VPIASAAVTDWVIEYGGGPVASIKKGFKNAAIRSGIAATPHMLRHSAAVWMAEAGRAMAEIAQYLGHNDQRTTEKTYARFTPDFLRGAAKALEW
jgi:integrase